MPFLDVSEGACNQYAIELTFRVYLRRKLISYLTIFEPGSALTDVACEEGLCSCARAIE